MLSTRQPRIHPLVAKLDRVADLTAEEITALGSISYEVCTFSAGQSIFQVGERPSSTLLVLEGFVGTSIAMDAGKRQIASLHIPGDLPVQLVHPHWALDVDIFAVSACNLACLNTDQFIEACRRSRGLTWVLWECAIVTTAINRDWIINVGHRPAVARLAHLFCEILARLEAVGLAQNGSCDVPLSQGDLSDTTGLHRTHVNRSLQELRSQGLLTFEHGRLTVHDRTALAAVGQFRPDYLRLPQPRWRAA